MRFSIKRLLIALLAMCLLSAPPAAAQLETRRAGDGLGAEQDPLLVPLNEQGKPLIGDVDGRTILPPAEQLKLQVEWVAKAGGLEPAQAELLLERGARAVEKRGGIFLQGGNVNWGGHPRWHIVDNRIQLTSNVKGEPTSRALRRALMPLLKDISPQAAVQVRSERDRLDAWRGQASLLAQVAVLDECLLLSGEQRTQLCASLAEATSDAWWRATSPGATLDTHTHQLLMLLSEAGLGEFIVPEADLARLLRPSQVTMFRELRTPVCEEVLLSNNVLPGLVEDALAEQAAAVDKKPHARQPTLRVGQDLETKEQQLGRIIEEWIDDIDAACRLTASQREKLALAGKLDIDRVCQPAAVTEKPAAHELAVQTVRLRAGADVSPLAILRDETSYFQKALQRVLDGEQRKELIQPQREFQRRALVEALVVGFESATALTVEQCEKLSRALNGALADQDLSEATDWRLECVRRIADLPIEKLEDVFFDFQLEAARRHKQRLAGMARFSAAAPIGIAQIVRDKNGRIFQMRLLREGTPGNGGQG